MPYVKPLVAALALMLTAPTAFSQSPALDSVSARQQMTAAGHENISDLEFRHGHWTAETRGPDGRKLDLLLDGDSGLVHVFHGRDSSTLSSTDVRTLVLDAGFVDVRDIEFDDAFWEVEAIDAHGREFDLVLHPVSGDILNAPQDPAGSTPLNVDDIRSRLGAAGYSRIEDLDFDDGRWEAEATNARGERVELKIDAYSGAVTHERRED